VKRLRYETIAMPNARLVERAQDPQGRVWQVVVIEAGVSANKNLYKPEVLRQAVPLFEGKPVAIYQFARPGGGDGFDHASMDVRRLIPEGVAGNVVGVLRNVRMGESDSAKQGKTVPAIIADLHVTDDWLRNTLMRAAESGSADFLELSIEAEGPHTLGYAEGQPVREIRQISRVEELTVVTKGAAGGKFLRLVASMQSGLETLDSAFGITAQELKKSLESPSGGAKEQALGAENTPAVKEAAKMNRKLLVRGLRSLEYTGNLEESSTEELHEALGARLAEMKTPDDKKKKIMKMVEEDNMEGAMQAIKACMDSYKEATTEPVEPVAEPASKTPEAAPAAPVAPEAPVAAPVAQPAAAAPEPAMTEAQKAVLEAAKRTELIECRMLLNEQLRESGLPSVATDELKRQFSGRTFKAEDLREAIEGQRKIVASLSRTPESEGAGVRVSVGAEKVDRMKKWADAMMGYKWQEADGLKESDKELYRLVPIRPSIRGFFREWFDADVWQMQKGQHGPGRIVEATTADLTYVLGDSTERALLQAYNQAEAHWQEVATIVPIDNFKTQKRILVGGLGIVPTVAEAGTYLQAGFPADEQVTYTAAKKGYLVQLTWEMIVNDDLDKLQAMPQEIANSCVHTLNELVWKTAIANNGGTIGADVSYDAVSIFNSAHDNLASDTLAYQPVADMWERLTNQRRFANVLRLEAAIGSTSATEIQLAKRDGTAITDITAFLKQGDVIQIDSEKMLVGSLPGSSGGSYANVTRGIGGTTAATHSDEARVEQLGAFLNPRMVKLVVPHTKRAEMFQILNSRLKPGGGNNDVSAIYPDVSTGRLSGIAIQSDYLGFDLDNWFMFADKPVEVGFLGGQQNPQILLQDDPMVGDAFTGDKYTWKCRQVYGMVFTDHRKAQASIASS